MSNAEIVPFNRRAQAMGVAALLLQNPRSRAAIANMVTQGAGKLGNLFSNNNQAPRPSVVVQPRSRAPRRGSRNRRRNTINIPRGVNMDPNANDILMTCRCVMTLVTTAAGKVQKRIFLGYKFDTAGGAAGNDLSSMSPQINALSGLYQYLTIKRLRVVFCPSVGDSASGTIAMSTLGDLTAAASVPNSFNSVYQRDRSVLNDLKEECSMTYVPSTTEEQSAKLANNATGQSGMILASYAPALLDIYVESDQVSKSIGILRFDILVKFERLS